MTNYQAVNPKNLFLSEGISFNQTTLFNGTGKVYVGKNVHFGYALSPHFHGFHEMIQAGFDHSIIEIGDHTLLSNDIAIRALTKISIGKNCLIGDRTTIYDSDFHEVHPLLRRRSPGLSKPVIIGNNVWIGSQVMILKGVTIGDNSIIGAGSVVSKDVPANSIAIGNPARIINKDMFSYATEEELTPYLTLLKNQIQSLIEQELVLEAKELLLSYFPLVKKDVELLSFLSVVYLKEAQYEEAEKILKTSLKIDSSHVDSLYNLAFLYEQINKTKESLHLYKQALSYCTNEIQPIIEEKIQQLQSIIKETNE